MNVLVLAGRLTNFRWSRGSAARDVVGALLQRGHRITLACESINAPLVPEPNRTLEFRPFHNSDSEWDLGFVRWLRRTRDSADRDVCLSLTHAAAGDFNIPLDLSPREFIDEVLAAAGLARLGKTIYKHPGAIVRSLASGTPTPRVGLSGLHKSSFLSESDAARTRAELRASLSISQSRTVLLLCAVHPIGRRLDPFLTALARACGETDRPPLVIAMTREPFSIHGAALRAGCAEHLRIVGLTEHPELLLAASDAAAAPVAQHGGRGRFVVDALRAGVPVLCARAAAGADLVAPPGGPAAGTLIDPLDVPGWTRAIRQVSDPLWHAPAAAAALNAGPRLSFESAIDEIERLLRQSAAAQ